MIWFICLKFAEALSECLHIAVNQKSNSKKKLFAEDLQGKKNTFCLQRKDVYSRYGLLLVFT